MNQILNNDFIVAELEDHIDEHQHGIAGIDSLLEVMFGFEHVVAEIFWNVVFGLVVYGFARARTLRKVHKYIDSKHGVSHEEGY